MKFMRHSKPSPTTPSSCKIQAQAALPSPHGRGNYKKESGNILVLILVAIALLAALSMMFLRTSQSTSDTAEYERASVVASEILRYAAGIENAVRQLRLRGCGENQISFWHDSDENGIENSSDDYYNSGAPTDHSCHIFEPEGAGIEFQSPKANWINNDLSASEGFGTIQFTRNMAIRDIGKNSNHTGMDLILWIPYLNQDICAQINRRNKEFDTSAGLTPPYDAPMVYRKYTGSFSGSRKLNLTPDPGNKGLKIGCGEDLDNGEIEGTLVNNGGTYSFYQVLLAR